MRSFDATQTARVAQKSKTYRWDLTIVDVNSVEYYYSTKATGSNIVIKDFSGLEFRSNSSEDAIIAPSDISFTISNPENTIHFYDLRGGSVLVELYLSNSAATATFTKIVGCKFRIKTANPIYQTLKVTAVDFLQAYLDGDCPNTRHPQDIFKSDREYSNGSLCVPVPIGVAYVPLRDVFVASSTTVTGDTISAVASTAGSKCKLLDSANGFGSLQTGKMVTITGFTAATNNTTIQILSSTAATLEFSATSGLETEAAGDVITLVQNNSYLMLGETGSTYTVTKIRNPRSTGTKFECSSASSSFVQTVLEDNNGNDWVVFQAFIADFDNDHIDESPGLWLTPGGPTLDPPVQFTKSNTATMTNFADAIAFVLKHYGVPAADIDEAVTFAAAHTTFDGWGLVCNGALWYKKDRRKVLSELLLQCHSCLQVGEKVELKVLSKTSKMTITSNEITRTNKQGPGSFNFSTIINEDLSDAAYVAWQKTGEAQDSFHKSIVPAGVVATVVSDDVLACEFVQDSQNAARAGILWVQRKFGRIADVSFNAKALCLALQPDDVITISGDNYGGTYNVLIESVKINYNLTLDLSCSYFRWSFDDWEDLTPAPLTIAEDDTQGNSVWQPSYTGPDSEASIPNLVKGRMRVGEGSSYVLIEPSNPLRISLYNNDVEIYRAGNLNGFLGYVTETYGLAIGEATKYLKYDVVNGLRIAGAISGSTIDIGGADASSFHVDIDGNMWLGAAAFNIATNPFAVSNAGVLRAVSGSIGGWTLAATTLTGTGVTLSSTGDAYLAIGTTPPTAPTTGTGIFINKTGFFGLVANVQTAAINADGTGWFGLTGAKAISWTTAGVVTVGGWTVAASKLSAGTDADYIGFAPATGIQLGDSTFADAKFSVTPAGAMKAVSGTVGGWTLGASSISASGITFNATTPAILMGSATDYLTGEGVFMGKNSALWKFHFGDPAHDYISYDGAGNLHITGTFTGSTSIDGTTANTFTVNSDLTDANADLVLGRTTGGNATFRWNGTIVTLDKTLSVPALKVTTSAALGSILVSDADGDLTYIADVAVGAYLRSGGVGTNPLWSTLILPNSAGKGALAVATAANTWGDLAVGTTGQILRGAGAATVPTWTTATYPATITAYALMVATGTNVIGELAVGGAGKLLMGVAGAVPIWTTPTFPNAATTTGAYLRADGTNFIQSTLLLPNAGTAYRLPVFSATNTMTELAASGATGEYLRGNTGAIPSWATLNQAAVAGLTTADSPIFVTVKLSGLTDGYVPYHVADATGLANSPIYTDGTNVGIGTTAPSARLHTKDTTNREPSLTFDAVAGTTLENAGVQIAFGTVGAVPPYAAWMQARQVGNVSWPLALNPLGGNVGIGTITPRKLADFLSTSTQLRLSYTDNSVYADFTVGAGGNLTVAPTGDFIFNPTLKDILPATNYDLNIGAINKKYLTLHAAELMVETLVAQDVMATLGGRILVAPTTLLVADLADDATTIHVKHNNLASGDRVYMESGGKVEFMSVDSGAGGSAGDYTYTVTRNLDGTGANAWYAGDAILNTGTTGDGFIDIYSVRGVKAATQYGPTVVGNVRNSDTYNDWTEAWAIGNLNGLYGYGVDTYGAAFGKYSAANYITIDPTDGIRFFDHDDVVQAQLTAHTWTLGIATTEHIEINSTSVQIKYNATVYTDLTAGILTLGVAADNVVINSDGMTVTSNSVTRLTALDAGVTAYGDNATTYTSVTSAGLSIYDNSILAGTFTSTAVTLNGASTGDQIVIDATGMTVKSGTVTRLTALDTGVIAYGDNATTYTSITASGLSIYDNSILAGTFTSTAITLNGASTNDQVVIDNTGMTVKSNNVTRLTALDAGVTLYGDNATTYASVTSAGLTIVDDSVTLAVFAATTTIGATAGGEYVSIASTGIDMYGNAAQRVHIGSDGTGWLGTSTGIIWDASGNISVAGAIVGGTIDIGSDSESLVDPDASVFTSGTYGWVAFGTNTLSNVAGQLVIDIVDNSAGARFVFSDASDLTQNLVVGKSYRLIMDAKVVGAGSPKIDIYMSATHHIYDTLTTTMTTYTVDFVAESTNADYLRFVYTSLGTQIVIDNIYLYEVKKNAFHVDATGNTWIGSSLYADAPIKFSNTGALTATGATIQSAASGARIILDSTGLAVYDASAQRAAILSTGAGWLGSASTLAWTTAGVVTAAGWTIGTAAIYKDGAAAANSSGLAPADYPFYAGAKYADRATAPFRITPAGALTATSATIIGDYKTVSNVGVAKGVHLSVADNELYFYGDRGDGTIEKLVTIGISGGGVGIIGSFGSANSARTAVAGYTSGSYAIFGSSISTGSAGVYGTSTDGSGTIGFSTNGVGVYGEGEWGVWGKGSTYGVYSEGPLGVKAGEILSVDHISESASAHGVVIDGVTLKDNTIIIGAVQVVGSRVVDARIDDAVNSGDVTTDGVIDALRDAMISHGLISAS